MRLSGGVSGVGGLKRRRHGDETLCRFFLDVRGHGRAPCGWMLATTGLSAPLGFIASPLHQVVPHRVASPETVRSAYKSKSANCSSMIGRIAYHSAGIGTAVLRTKPRLRCPSNTESPRQALRQERHGRRDADAA
jgi:hypothetical protein